MHYSIIIKITVNINLNCKVEILQACKNVHILLSRIIKLLGQRNYFYLRTLFLS